MSLVQDDEVAAFRNSGQFDEHWYVEEYPDVRLAGIDPAKHYLWIGKRLGRRPRAAHAAAVVESRAGNSPSVAAPEPGAQARRSASAQVASAQQRRFAQLAAAHRQVRNDLEHASSVMREISRPVQVGKLSTRSKRRKLSRTQVFDRRFVRNQIPDMPPRSVQQYLRDPAYYRVDPHPLFAAGAYLERYPDVVEAGVSPLQHYLEHGWREGRDPHPYFANDWYLERNPDVLESGASPLEHYLEHGWKEGRQPNPVFSPAEYLDRYPDVRSSGMEPLSHYVLYGRDEKRDVPFKGFERDWRSLVPYSNEAFLMDHLMFDQVPVAPTESEASATDNGASWPPKPLNGYWPPQTLRDFVLDSYGDEALSLYWYVYSVMDAYVDDPEAFPASDACRLIISRAKERSAARAAAHKGKLDASIIVPVYNNFLDTMLCVASVLELETNASLEIIVADDGSTDATPDVLPQLGGVVRHVRQPRNLGFLGNCNAAATAAKGKTIILLNNDTVVLPGWLDGLLSPFDRLERVGFVGSKLLNWDGTLQEAGGIFWNDGSAWNFGRNQDARAPEFNYLKDADYCSGASIAVPAVLWREFGGFDPVFAPAYCEDSDLAFRVRSAGYRTIYNPRSEVIHHEGRSHGRDVASGIKAYQVTNQERLLERWGEVLRREHFPNAQNVLRARDRSRNRKHVLVIDHYVPQWDQDAGSRTIFQYLEILIELGFKVTFWPDNLYFDSVYAPILQEMGVEVIHGPSYRDHFGEFIKERADLYDAVFLSRPHVAVEYLPLIKQHSRARILYYGHDLHFRRMQASRDLGQRIEPEAIAEMRELELRVCRECDVIFYPDPDELKVLAGEIGDNHIFIANPVFVYDDAQIEAARARLDKIQEAHDSRLLFVGGFNHTPNREGILWFVERVLPLIADRIPDVRFDVAGSNPPPEVVALASERVTILGRVSDEKLDELYKDASLAVAPLRYGAGVKGKVIEAMAFGIPVGTTSVGGQGIDIGQEGLFIGDQPEELADAIIRGLTDRVEAQRRAENALDYIRQRYGRSEMLDVFRRLIVENATV